MPSGLLLPEAGEQGTVVGDAAGEVLGAGDADVQLLQDRLVRLDGPPPEVVVVGEDGQALGPLGDEGRVGAGDHRVVDVDPEGPLVPALAGHPVQARVGRALGQVHEAELLDDRHDGERAGRAGGVDDGEHLVDVGQAPGHRHRLGGDTLVVRVDRLEAEPGDPAGGVQLVQGHGDALAVGVADHGAGARQAGRHADLQRRTVLGAPRARPGPRPAGRCSSVACA